MCFKALPCEVLFGAAGFGGVLSCLVLLGKALFWQGGVVQSEVHYAEVSLRRGTVESGFARLRAAGQALVSLSSGMVTQGSVMRGAASSRFGLVW